MQVPAYSRLNHLGLNVLRPSLRIMVLLAGISLSHLALGCDAPGTKDHPLLPRYEGACLMASKTTAFERFKLPLGQPKKIDNTWTTEPVENLEGAVTRLIYAAPSGRSALEVLRNYEQGLVQRGYQILYQCSDAACGRKDVLLNNVLFPREQRRSLASGDRIYYAFTGTDQQHYLAAKKSDGTAYTSIYVGTSNFKSTATTDLMGRAIILADVIEPAQMEMRMIDAEAMAQSIQTTGKVALNNVYFDLGKATLTSESKPALDEMVKLLRNNPSLAVFVVGHTDNTGDYSLNLTLSQQRADAVVAALVSQGIAANRLRGVGVASVAPLASNRSEAGRAENRRVELVER